MLVLVLCLFTEALSGFRLLSQLPSDLFDDFGEPNLCRQTVDWAHANGQKLCRWAPDTDDTLLCEANDFSGDCGSVCSTTTPGLGKYTVCSSSPVCGEEDVFMDQIHTFRGEFYDEQQLCVYRIVLTEYDPMDKMDDYVLNVAKLH